MIRSLLLRTIGILSLALFALGPNASLATVVVQAAPVPVHTAASPQRANCNDNSSLCTETYDGVNYEGHYTGHDEPSLLFYSNAPGSGNSSRYQMTLPKDPPTPPKQDGTGGTFNFQLHPAFWFGMALCDSQSSPNFTNTCTPNSDSNIFDSADPSASHYIGKHPGTAFMEMQFYPPGWVPWPAGDSCDGTKWCAALNIDSLSQSLTQNNNADCLNKAGLEYVNFAFITKSGKAHAPADPTTVFQPPFAATTPNPATDLFMNSGDRLIVDLHDTPAGFQIVIRDLTTGENGSMTTSIANGFKQLKFDPAASSCTTIPYAFHPMYATSSEHTRVPWAAHSYNIAFSDEIGHFEYCNAADATGACTSAGVTDPAGIDGDDDGCFNAADSTLIQIAGCLSFSTDFDFDGPEYSNHWPGTLANPKTDRSLNPQPIRFSSPLFKPSGGDGGNLKNYSRVAFENDLPRIEGQTIPPCQRHVSNPADPHPGQDCVNPPVGASFYPIFSTWQGGSGGDNQVNHQDDGRCLWQLGGANIPGTTNSFGGSSNAEYGPLLTLAYAAGNGQPTIRDNDFRRILSNNPCPAQSNNN